MIERNKILHEGISRPRLDGECPVGSGESFYHKIASHHPKFWMMALMEGLGLDH